jgi:hypothetical protein
MGNDESFMSSLWSIVVLNIASIMGGPESRVPNHGNYDVIGWAGREQTKLKKESGMAQASDEKTRRLRRTL